MTQGRQDKLTETSRKPILRYLNPGILTGAKDTRTTHSLAVKKAANQSSSTRDPLAEILISALTSPKTETENEMIQILPAQGWMAILAGEPELFNKEMTPLPKYHVKPLICWALKRKYDEVQQKYRKVVVGIVDHGRETCECSLLSNFLMYRVNGSEKEDKSLREAWFKWWAATN